MSLYHNSRLERIMAQFIKSASVLMLWMIIPIISDPNKGLLYHQLLFHISSGDPTSRYEDTKHWMNCFVRCGFGATGRLLKHNTDSRSCECYNLLLTLLNVENGTAAMWLTGMNEVVRSYIHVACLLYIYNYNVFIHILTNVIPFNQIIGVAIQYVCEIVIRR